MWCFSRKIVHLNFKVELFWSLNLCFHVFYLLSPLVSNLANPSSTFKENWIIKYLSVCVPWVDICIWLFMFVFISDVCMLLFMFVRFGSCFCPWMFVCDCSCWCICFSCLFLFVHSFCLSVYVSVCLLPRSAQLNQTQPSPPNKDEYVGALAEIDTAQP